MLLGLDISSKATGVAFVRGTHVGAHVCMRIPLDDSLERAIKQHDALDGMLKGERPDFAVIEAYAFRARGRAKHMLYEAGTLLRYVLWKRHVPWFVVNPSQLKKFATGYGNAKKDAMVQAASDLMGFKTKDDNVADAALLGLVGHCVSYVEADEDPLLTLDDVQLEIVTALTDTYRERVLRKDAT